MKVIRAEELELCVMEAIERLVHDDMDFVWDGLAEQMNTRIREMAKGSDLPRLKDSKASLEKRKSRLLDAYLAGAVELEVFRSRSLGIDAELSRIALEISKQSGEIPDEVDGETVRAAFLYYFEKEKTHADDRAHFFRVFIDRIVRVAFSSFWRRAWRIAAAAASRPTPIAMATIGAARGNSRGGSASTRCA